MKTKNRSTMFAALFVAAITMLGSASLTQAGPFGPRASTPIDGGSFSGPKTPLPPIIAQPPQPIQPIGDGTPDSGGKLHPIYKGGS
jgi:hypothetical protein